MALGTVLVPHAAGQGLLGERYLSVDGGWERLENGDSDDGWGAGATVNIPGPRDPMAAFGMDLAIEGNYMDVFDRDIYDVDGVIRAYTMPGEAGIRAFVGAGFGWVDYDLDDTTYVPVEGGIELTVGRFSVLPYYRYIFALDSAFDDYWAAGANGVFWVDEIWGFTASFEYRDLDDVDVLGGVDTGWSARAGLIFSF